MTELKASARAVQDALSAAGLELQVTQLPASTRSARDAAAAIGCGVAEIAKSIVFRAANSHRAVLVIASGSNRIVETRIAEHLGEPVEQATPDFVREQTGFAIGGVPPCAHLNQPIIYIDREVLGFDRLWAAAGTPNAVFPIAPSELLQLTGGTVIDIH